MEQTVKKLENRIAKRILRNTGAVTLGLCTVILSSFGWGLWYYWGRSEISSYELLQLLLILISVVCTSTVVLFVLLWRISLHAAKECVQPLVEGLEREKSFTSFASHELRTPLAVIKGSLEVLIRKPRTEEEYTKKIRENLQVVNNMNMMVDNLLTLTRVENDKSLLSVVSLSVKDALTEACSHAADVMIHRSLKVTLDVVPEELTVHTDPRALMTMLDNIISNAAKYCNDGGHVAMRAKQAGEEVIIEVENSGPGIPTEEARKAFEPFYRSINSGHQRIEGYGLGLAIVGSFAQITGTEVTLHSCKEGPTVVQLKMK